MHQAGWKTESVEFWPERLHLSPPPAGIVVEKGTPRINWIMNVLLYWFIVFIVLAEPSKPAGVYRPPGARGGSVVPSSAPKSSGRSLEELAKSFGSGPVPGQKPRYVPGQKKDKSRIVLNTLYF